MDPPIVTGEQDVEYGIQVEGTGEPDLQLRDCDVVELGWRAIAGDLALMDVALPVRQIDRADAQGTDPATHHELVAKRRARDRVHLILTQGLCFAERAGREHRLRGEAACIVDLSR